MSYNHNNQANQITSLYLFLVLASSTAMNKTFGKEDRVFLDLKIKNRQVSLDSGEKYVENLKRLIGYVEH